jgi:hypothetical protein
MLRLLTTAVGTNRRSFGISLMPAMGGSCGHFGRGLDRARPPPLTHSRQSAADFAVVHNGPRDVVVYGRRPMGGLGETASHYDP